MKLYLLTHNIRVEYDTYDSCVVASSNKEDARLIHPGGKSLLEDWDDWPHPKHIRVKEIGIAHPSIKKGVICASFNAG